MTTNWDSIGRIPVIATSSLSRYLYTLGVYVPKAQLGVHSVIDAQKCGQVPT